MEEKNEYVSSFVNFTNTTEGGKVRVITDDDGKELGFEVSGIVTTFDVRNGNGYVFTKNSYDKFIDEYYTKNSLNIPMCIEHQDGWQNIAGKVKTMTKTDKGVEMVGYVPRYVYAYNWIKNAIEDGILQGFSNAGGAAGTYNKETGEFIIENFNIAHVALVCQPADITAKFTVSNTAFNGFNEEPKKETKPETNDDWRDIV